MPLYDFFDAKLEGIKVEFVDPAHTSQSYPTCFVRSKTNDFKYKCKCGFVRHCDVVSAMNIRCAPVVDGESQSA